MSRASSDHAAHTDALGDADLTRLARQGDPAAFRTIMRRHNRRLFRVARSILRDDSEAEDMVQEAYVRAFTALAGFRGEASLSTWLTRITLNEALGRLRRRQPTVDLTVLDTTVLDGSHPRKQLARPRLKPDQALLHVARLARLVVLPAGDEPVVVFIRALEADIVVRVERVPVE